MRRIRILLCFCAICILTTAVVSAQNGADVDRFEWPDGEPFRLVAWDGGSIISVHSYDDPFINCGDDIPELQPGWREISELPNDIVQTLDHRNWFTRVMVGTEEEFWTDPCAFIQTAERLAEGITSGTYHATWNPSAQHYVSGYTVAGPLYDLVGMCGDGMVGFNLTRKQKWSAKKGFKIGPNNGPRLSCNE